MTRMSTDRPVEVKSPLGDGVLLFYRMTATEELGRLSRFDLEVWSEDHAIAIDDLLGEGMAVKMVLADNSVRCFHGYVSAFSQIGAHAGGVYSRYRVELRPWLWFLTRTADCRIFQGKSVIDILKQIFGDHGFPDLELRLEGSYDPLDYCVQYRESDFNFVSRLMEREGLYYYFAHEEDKHTLVIADSVSVLDTIPGCEQVPCMKKAESDEEVA